MVGRFAALNLNDGNEIKMPYTTPIEVQGDFKDMEFTTTGNISTADVEGFILEADALINSYLSARYTTPITESGNGLTLLKFYSRCLVTARIKKVLEVKQDKSGETNQNVVGVLLSPQQVIAELIKIQKGQVDLGGGTFLDSDGGFYSKNVSCDVQPVIRKNERQW